MAKYSKIYEPRRAIFIQTTTVDQAGLELKAILLPQLPESYDHRYEPPCLIKHRGKIKFMCRQCSLCTRRNQTLSQWKPVTGNLSRQVLPPCPCLSHTTPQLPTQEASRLASRNSLNTLLRSSCRRSAPTNFFDPLFPSEIFPYFLHDVTCYDFNTKCPSQAHV